MTDIKKKALALVDHIRSDLTYITGLADHMEAGGDVSKKNIGDLIAIVRWNAEHHLECRDTIETQAREIERLRGALQSVVDACDQGKLTPLGGPCGMTIEAQIMGSVYNRVPAWPVEEARAALAGDSHDQ